MLALKPDRTIRPKCLKIVPTARVKNARRKMQIEPLAVVVVQLAARWRWLALVALPKRPLVELPVQPDPQQAQPALPWPVLVEAIPELQKLAQV